MVSKAQLVKAEVDLWQISAKFGLWNLFRHGGAGVRSTRSEIELSC